MCLSKHTLVHANTLRWTGDNVIEEEGIYLWQQLRFLYIRSYTSNVVRSWVNKISRWQVTQAHPF